MPKQHLHIVNLVQNVHEGCFSYYIICVLSIVDYVNKLKVVYSQKVKKGGTQKPSRVISNVPERILDAPEVRDDYCK